MADQWYVYMLKCNKGEYYTGVAKDLWRRVNEHNNGKCRYTRYRRPVKLIFEEGPYNYSSARKREKEIKDYSRKKKERLLAR